MTDFREGERLFAPPTPYICAQLLIPKRVNASVLIIIYIISDGIKWETATIFQLVLKIFLWTIFSIPPTFPSYSQYFFFTFFPRMTSLIQYLMNIIQKLQIQKRLANTKETYILKSRFFKECFVNMDHTFVFGE